MDDHNRQAINSPLDLLIMWLHNIIWIQDGCPALDFKIAEVVTSEEELTALIESSRTLIKRLREMEN